MRKGAAVLLLAALCACGKRGDPRPPLRIVPQPVTELRLAQRGERLETSFVAPRLATDGSRLGVVEIELRRTAREGAFDALAERSIRRAAPGEALAESEPLPPAGTTVRAAARALLKGRASAETPLASLTVREPPLAPQALTAEVTATGVVLRWIDPNPTPPPSPSPEPSVSPSPTPSVSPASSPSATASASPTATTGATVAPPAASSPPAPPGPSPAPSGPAVVPAGATPAPGAASSPAAPSPTPPPPPPPPSTGIWIYRREKQGSFSRPLRAEPLAGTHFEDTAVVPGQEWCYVVTYVSSTTPVVESAPAGEVCAAFEDIQAPAAPIGIAIVLQEGGLEISWSPSPEADLAGYRVYRAAPPGATPELIAEVPAQRTSFQDAAARRGIPNAYTVTAVDKDGNESIASTAVQVRP